MTRKNFNLKEKVLLYAFGTENKEETIANIYGADKLAAPWYGGFSIETLNVLYALLDSKTTPQSYREEYTVAVEDVEEAMDNLEMHAETIGKGDPNSVVPIWWNYAKATMICSFWEPDLDESIWNMKILACYVKNSKVKQLVDNVQWTLECIKADDPTKFQEYWKQYREIAMIGRVKDELGDDELLNYVMEVQDVLSD
ncbi:MAG: hypothetical protein Q4B26_08840 [Eubacteriales bacterium]|nr:hypothetical protein [Eubacteriales bacterium]